MYLIVNAMNRFNVFIWEYVPDQWTTYVYQLAVFA